MNVHDDGFRKFGLARLDNEQAERLSNVEVEPNDVLLNITGASVARCCLVPRDVLPARVNQHVSIIRPTKEGIDSAFLRYLLISKDYKERLLSTGEGGGSTRQAITKAQLQEFTIRYPKPISEQQRIVGILDKAFEGIATAKANAEKNLQNARALFESHLQSVFFQHGPGWVVKPISECFKVRSGDFLPAKAMVEIGNVDVYGGNGVNGRHNQHNLSGRNIIIGRVGAKCGNVRGVEGNVWVTDNAFYISEYCQEFDLGFLAQLLDRKQLRRTANQAAQPVISYTTIKDVVLEFPTDISAQKKISDALSTLEAETQRLASIYQRKLAALEALKKSLLHQAFTDKL